MSTLGFLEYYLQKFPTTSLQNEMLSNFLFWWKAHRKVQTSSYCHSSPDIQSQPLKERHVGVEVRGWELRSPRCLGVSLHALGEISDANSSVWRYNNHIFIMWALKLRPHIAVPGQPHPSSAPNLTYSATPMNYILNFKI